MRTTYPSTDGPSGISTTVQTPDALLFMYSPQPVIVETPDAPDASSYIEVTVTSMETRKSHTEKRFFHNGAVEFDVSRTMQLLAQPVEKVLSRVDFGGRYGLAERFKLEIGFRDYDGILYPLTSYDDIQAMYGALDQGESYSAKKVQRRLWLNYPQTFSLQRASDGFLGFMTPDGDMFETPRTDEPENIEASLVDSMNYSGAGALVDKLYAGSSMELMVTRRYRVADGEAVDEFYSFMTVVPDTCRSGVYLRWLNREGGVSYWLFQRSQQRTTAAVRSSHEAFIEGNPAAPVKNIYQSPRKADYREARELVLGAVGLSADEYDDLCSLAVSPAVEMLVLDRDPDVRLEGPQKWMQVTVTASTYARDIRRTTPSSQDLEFTIELPERNTVRL